jgi:hypothetical protein
MPQGLSGFRRLSGTGPISRAVNALADVVARQQVIGGNGILVSHGSQTKVSLSALAKGGKRGAVAEEALPLPFEVVETTSGSEVLTVKTGTLISSVLGEAVTISYPANFSIPAIGSVVTLTVTLDPGTLAATAAAIGSGAAWSGYPNPIVLGTGGDAGKQVSLKVALAVIVATSSTLPGKVYGTKKVCQLVNTGLCLFITAINGRAACVAMPWPQRGALS